MTLTSWTLAAVLLIAAPWKAELPLNPPKHGGVYVAAHRGAHKDIPENTLAAYKKAIELGADFVEIDIRTTKDGKLISMHNRDVDAYVTDGTKGKVREMTLEQLRALDIGSRIGPQFKDEKVPTFEEILDLCKGRIGVYLDHKDAAVPQVEAMIRQRGMEHQVVWYSSESQIKELRALNPECIEMPEGGSMKTLPTVLEAVKPRVVAAVWKNYSKEFVDACHAAGAIAIVDEEDSSSWEDALAWGSDGIQTDDPEGLIAFLETKAKSQPAKK